jgi:hypothetical protein
LQSENYEQEFVGEFGEALVKKLKTSLSFQHETNKNLSNYINIMHYFLKISGSLD